MAKRDPWVIIDVLTGEYLSDPTGKIMRFASEKDALPKMIGKPNLRTQFKR